MLSRVHAFTEMPKSLREVVQRFAASRDVVAISSALRKIIEPDPKQTTADVIQVQLREQLPLNLNDGWETGVEHLAGYSDADIYADLGIPTRFPLLQEWMDRNEEIEEWTPNGEKWLNTPSDRRIAVSLRRHQLEGVHKLAENMVNNKHTLMMDGVGVGKTFQAIALVALRAFWLTIQYPRLNTTANELKKTTARHLTAPPNAANRTKQSEWAPFNHLFPNKTEKSCPIPSNLGVSVSVCHILWHEPSVNDGRLIWGRSLLRLATC